MNRKELFEESTSDSIVAWKIFRDTYAEHKRELCNTKFLYSFYEGQDDSKYYNNRIENFQNLNVSHVECKGKEKLLSINKIIKIKRKNYKKGKFLFFADKDFDNIINKRQFKELKKIKNLYITPSYAIENFYTTLRCFQRILKSEFILKGERCICETDNEYIKLCQIFTARQNEFHDSILDINAWIATQNYFIINKDNDVKVAYGQLNLFTNNNPIITLDLNSVQLNETNLLNFLENKFANSFKLTDLEVKKKFDEIKLVLSKNKQKKFRGKFEEDFLGKFLRKLMAECNTNRLTNIGINSKIKVNLTLNSILSNLSQYADTPKSLKTFIQNN